MSNLTSQWTAMFRGLDRVFPGWSRRARPVLQEAALIPVLATVGAAAIALLPQPSRAATLTESLSFGLPPDMGQSGDASDAASALTPSSDPIPAQWWEQGSASPIAIAVGHAEGTRQPDGSKNEAYYWHSDPGNGADNFGTFSYQHFSAAYTQDVRREHSPRRKREVAAAQSLPETADHNQMQRLRGFYQQLQHQAQTQGLVLTLLEALNGLDLINQSEAAGLSRGGYIDWLATMRRTKADAAEQITEARSWAYWHPEYQTWDAPGLGNSYPSIRRDQARRFEAVRQVLETNRSNTYIPLASPQPIAFDLALNMALESPLQGLEPLPTEGSHRTAAVTPPPRTAAETAVETAAETAVNFSVARIVTQATVAAENSATASH